MGCSAAFGSWSGTAPSDGRYSRPVATSDQSLSTGSDRETLAGADTEAALAEMATLEGSETDDGGASAPVDASEGAQIAHYELIRLLGQGGMGTVHLARDTRLGRRVALKRLRPGAPARIERFFQEARATARLQHENIVVIHEVGEHEGAPYMVLEYLEGRPLRALLGHPLPARRAVELAVPIAQALAHAHRHGIIHRDLKPENVFLTDAGIVKVLDFGIAKLIGRDGTAPEATAGSDTTSPVAPGLTSVGAILGTLRYMAPEQRRGEPVDGRADQYALGLMLYEMIAGRQPLAESVGRQGAVRPLSEWAPSVPAEVDRLVTRCLQIAPDDRFESVRELLEALRATLPAAQGRLLGDDESPYPGLTPFRERDAAHFFGRGRDVSRVVAMLEDHPLVAVVGPSGVGKSSLIRAGVVPSLRAGKALECFTLRPGRHPLTALAAMLIESTTDGSGRRSQEELESVVDRLREEPGYLGAVLRRRCAAKESRALLFVDQLEEAFTLSTDAAEVDAFFECLLGVADDPSSPLRVAFALRSDFLDRLGGSARVLDAVNRGVMLLRQADRSQLEAALLGPAELAGYRFEDRATVEAMLDALDGNTAALPLLQFAAAQLWETRDRARRCFTHAAYEATGGVTGLLAKHADAVLAGLPADARSVVRSLFMLLVTSDRTRAIVEREELRGVSADPERAQALIDRLVTARLVVVQGGEAGTDAVYELAHEALIEAWPTLARWLDEGQEHAGYLEQLSAGARQWDRKGRPAGLVWRGVAAADAEHFARHYEGRLAPREREYLDAVLQLQRRSRRVRRGVVATVIAVLAALVVAGSVMLVRISAAEDDAVAQATRAKDSAAIVTRVNAKLKQQIDAVQAKERQRAEAQQAAETAGATARAKGSALAAAEGDLRQSNADLQTALDQAKADEARARAAEREAGAAAKRAQAAADKERALRKRLKAALDREQERVKELERRARRIQTRLR